jgi:transcriptional regulator with XRE-family HTH domain
MAATKNPRRSARLAKGWTVEEFAKKARLSVGTVRAFERGDIRHLSLRTFGRLCRILGIGENEALRR